MQFTSFIVAFAAMAATTVSAETVTVYACSSTAVSSGFAPSTVALTGAVTAPTATSSPITYATGAASMNTVSGLAAILAGGVALFL